MRVAPAAIVADTMNIQHQLLVTHEVLGCTNNTSSHTTRPDYVQGVGNVFLRKTSHAEKWAQGTNFLHPRSPPSVHIVVTFSLYFFLLVPSMFTATFLYSSSVSGPFMSWIVSNSTPSSSNGLFSFHQ